jgi:hypothetical protein
MIEPAEPPHSHHHATGIPWFDLLVPTAVIVVSVASLLTSLESERSMKALVEQNRRLVSAQSTPLLMYDTSNDTNGKSVIQLTLSNEGTGPARLFWFKAVDSQGVDYTGSALTERAMKIDPHGAPSSQQINDTLMRSGDERTIFAWPKPKDNPAAIAAWEKLNHERFHLHLSACYCSMFDECRITEFGMSQPKSVSSCEQDASGGS